MFKLVVTASVIFFAASTISGQVIKSAMINGCKTEGLNEYLIIKNGNSNFVPSASTIDIRYGTSSPASTTITDQLLSNGDSAYIAALNAKLSYGCDFNFINATSSTTIKSNSYFMVMHKYPDDTSNFSAWCGQGTGDVYVVFSDDASWGNSGIFANDTRGTTRYLKSIINGVTFDYNYGGINLNSDGGYVTWNDTAGTFVSSGTYVNCTPTNLQSLPVSLLYFNTKLVNEDLILTWATGSEHNNDYFSIEAWESHKSNWIHLADINGLSFSQAISVYEYALPKAWSNYNYYQLSQTDFDGKKTVLAVASTKKNTKGLAILEIKDGNILLTTDNKESPVVIKCYNLNGSLISSESYPPTNSIIEYLLPKPTAGCVVVSIHQDYQHIIKKINFQF